MKTIGGIVHAGGETIAELESGRGTKLKVDHEAARQTTLTLKEFLGGSESLGRNSIYAQVARKRLPNRLVVIDDTEPFFDGDRPARHLFY